MRIALAVLFTLDVIALCLAVRMPEEQTFEKDAPARRTPWALTNVEGTLLVPEGTLVFAAGTLGQRAQTVGFLRFGALKVLDVQPLRAALFENADSVPAMRLQAERAILDVTTRDITLHGNVTLENGSGVTFCFRTLTWREHSRRFVAESAFSVRDSGGSRNAHGFSAPLTLEGAAYTLER